MLIDFKLFRILGVSPSATDEEIKRNYRDMAKVVHPDKVTFFAFYTQLENHEPAVQQD
jgi:curved DNA-binding protein CbpA